MKIIIDKKKKINIPTYVVLLQIKFTIYCTLEAYVVNFYS